MILRLSLMTLLCQLYTFIFLMLARPPRTTRTDTRFPYTTLYRSARLREVARVKVRSHERRTLEAAMPPEMRYVKGWPPRMPSLAEAALIDRKSTRLNSSH